MIGGRVSAILSLKGICKSFGAVVIAENLDLNLGEGEALGMLGPNGAGKTTLFGIITGMLAPGAGQILFQGNDITGLSAAHRCRLGMARSFQIPQPFGGMSVFENLVVAGAFAKRCREREVYNLAAQILDDCGLGEKANVKADKLTLLDRKRLELARALATGPKLLLLDEVAGGLSEMECETLVTSNQAYSRDRCVDHLDRTHRACVVGDGRPHRRFGRRYLHCRRPASRRSSPPESYRNLHGYAG